MDARAVDAFLDAVDGHELHGMLLLRHGHVVAEGAWAPYRLEEPQLLYSLSKAFTGAAVALAVGEGRLGLDDRVLDHLPEYAQRTTPALRDLRLRHVLTMASGHHEELLTGDHRAGDLVDLLLTTPPEHAPGTWFAYNQPTSLTAAAIVQRVTGERLLDYLRPRLLDPLEVGPATWDQDALGRDLGFSGIRLALEAVAAYGQLLLDHGRWHGWQILPEWWVADAARAHVSTAQREEPDWAQGYGYQIWLCRNGFRHDGAFGQFCLVLPEQDAVLATTASTEDMQAVLDAVWTHLLPGMSETPMTATPPDAPAGHAERAQEATAETAETTLALRLSRLEITLPRLAPVTGTTSYAVRGPLTDVTEAELGPDGIRWTRDDGSHHQTLAVSDRWSDVEWPTAAGPLRCRSRAGLTTDGAPYATLAVVDAPHRLVLAGAGDELLLDWARPPLWELDPATLVAT